jgi:Holliday junction resolvase RusA-like endonuclease
MALLDKATTDMLIKMAKLNGAGKKSTIIKANTVNAGKKTKKPLTPSWKKNPRLARQNAPGDTLEFFIDIEPRPKERARTFADDKSLIDAFIKAKGDTRTFMALVKTNLMRSVTPEATRVYETAISISAGHQMKQKKMEPYTCAVEFEIAFVFSGSEDYWPTAQGDGDLDNLEKALLDGLNKIVYTDDKLVVQKTSIKLCGPKSGIYFRVRPARIETDTRFKNLNLPTLP